MYILTISGYDSEVMSTRDVFDCPPTEDTTYEIYTRSLPEITHRQLTKFITTKSDKLSII